MIARGAEARAQPMGALRAEYRRGRKFNIKTVAAATVVFLLGAAFVVPLPFFSVAELGLSTFVGLALTGFVLCGLSVWSFVAWARGRDVRIQFHDGGILETRRGRERRFLWDDIARLWRETLRMYMNGVPIGTHHRHRIETTRGERLLLTHELGDIEELADRLEHEVWIRLGPGILKSVARGESVTFGDFVLAIDGIAHKRRKLRWTDFVGFNVEGGIIRIRARGRRSAWATTTYAKIPNARIFLAALDQRSPRPAPAS